MNIVRIIGFYFALMMLIQPVVAQVFPPEFNCIRNDTLLWDIPSNSCGSFNSYEIYFSTSANGPFNLLSSVPNPSQDFFHHPNPGGSLFYYFMKTNMNCPGEQVLCSDTINTRPPEIGPIVRVSVEAGSVRLEWDFSPSPETSAYIIYRIEDNGTFPIDTVYNQSFYIDIGADEDVQPESYFVVAIDQCDNTSIFGDSHTTIHLSAEVINCEQSLNLSWNPYVSWLDGVEKQQIWLSENNNPFQLIAELDPAINLFVVEGIKDMVDYAIRIEAINANNSTVVSRSNEVSLTADVVNPIRELTILSLTSVNDQEIEIQWQWNDDAGLKQYEILRTGNGATTNSPGNVGPVLDIVNSYVDQNLNPAEEIYSYQIQTWDFCDSVSFSNSAKSVVLQANQIDNSSNSLSWSEFEMERAELEKYDLYRIGNGKQELIASLDLGENSFEDVFDPLEFTSNLCYLIIARASIDLLDGSKSNGFIQSNLACVQPAAFAVVPNAFAPFGKNDVFKPVLFNRSSIAEYNFNVWNRWGTLVFETSLEDTGWNGRYNGAVLGQGTYVYAIQIRLNNGDLVEYKGNVLLLR